jgi:hypothetical protein
MPKKKTADGHVALEYGTPARNFAANKAERSKVNWERPARRSKRR